MKKGTKNPGKYDSFNSIDDFKLFLKDYPEIKTRSQFAKKFSRLYKRYLELKKSGIIEDFPLELEIGGLSDFKTSDDFQKYVEENEIKSPEEFLEKNEQLYRRLINLRLSSLIDYRKDVNSKESFLVFIEENSILSKLDFFRRFRNTYNKMKDLGLEEELFPSKSENQTKEVWDLNKFQTFIKDHNIKNRSEFKRNYRNIYDKACKIKLLQLIIFPTDENKLPETKEEFQKFISDNKIDGIYDLSKRFNRVYHKLKKSGFEKDMIYEGPISSRKQFLESFNIVEDFQSYIKNNNIKSPKEFRDNDPGLYRKMTDLGINTRVSYGEEYDRVQIEKNNYRTFKEIQDFINLKDIKSKSILKKNHRNIYNHMLALSSEERSNIKFTGDRKILTTLEEVQEFIIKNKILSKTDLKIKFHGEYMDYKNILRSSEENKDVVFLKCSKARSKQELLLLIDLIKHNIKNFKYQLKITYDKDSKVYYDFYLLDFNIIIEVHGPQHFSAKIRPENWDQRDEEKNDKFKYELALRNGYKVYYIAYDSWDFYKRSEYFQPVYHSIEDLFSHLGIELQENINYKQDFMNLLFSNDFIKLINKICQEFKISSIEDLKKYDNIYWICSELNIQNKIIYYDIN